MTGKPVFGCNILDSFAGCCPEISRTPQVIAPCRTQRTLGDSMAQLPRPSDHAGTGFEPQNGGNNVEKHESDVTCNVRNGQWLHFLVVVALAFQPRPEVSNLSLTGRHPRIPHR